MLESVYICYQIIPNFLNFYDQQSTSYNFFNFYDLLTSNYGSQNNFMRKNQSMEYLIEHFKHYSEGRLVSTGISYQSIEAPKGEFGVTLVADNTSQPFRCKIRTPAYHHLQLMSFLMHGHMFADMITILGSQDIVFGEVDR
jgi:NADH:ubiquinone oxidoreductase subunit D